MHCRHYSDDLEVYLCPAVQEAAEVDPLDFYC